MALLQRKHQHIGCLPGQRPEMASLNSFADTREEPLLGRASGGRESSRAWTEAKQLIHLSWPVAFATLARLAIYTTDTAFVGHIGTDQLSGVTLAQSWTQFLAVIVWSSAYALNSICSQAVGAGNPKLAGNWLQLSVALCTLLSVPVCAAYFFTEPVVKLIAPEQEDVAGYGQRFNSLAVLFFWPTVMYMALRQFFQAVQIVLPATIVSAATIGVNVGLNALLVNGVGEWGGMGLEGSPIATLVSMLFQLGSFLCFTVLWKKYHAPFWGGWTRESFRKDRVTKFLKLVVPMTIGSAIENWQVDGVVLPLLRSTLASGWLCLNARLCCLCPQLLLNGRATPPNADAAIIKADSPSL